MTSKLKLMLFFSFLKLNIKFLLRFSNFSILIFLYHNIFHKTNTDGMNNPVDRVMCWSINTRHYSVCNK